MHRRCSTFTTCGRGEWPRFGLFFFVLSGFVLGKSEIQAQSRSSYSYLSYLVRRIFRLYPAILFSLIIAYLIARLMNLPVNWPIGSSFPKGTISSMRSVDSIGPFMDQVIIKNSKLIGCMWSLKVEIMCGLFIPLFIFIILNKNLNLKYYTLFILAYLSIQQGYDINIINDQLWPLHYLFVFYIGSLISAIPNKYYLNKEASRCALFFVAMLLFWSFTQDHYETGLTRGALSLSILLGVFLYLMIPCNYIYIKKILILKPLVLLGRISYSFYLLHWPILFLTYYFIARNIPSVFQTPKYLQLLILLFSSSAFAAFVGYFSEKFIENPLNIMGNKIAKKLFKTY